MRFVILGIVGVLGCACGSTQAPSMLAGIVEVPEADLCPTSLGRAIEEARGARSDDDVLVLSQAMRWALDHHELRCTPSITARVLWRECLAALTRIRSVSASLAIAVSLEQTHLPGSLNDRHNATFREQTEAALQALEQTGPHGAEVIGGVLRWYGAGSADCSCELYRSRVVAMMIAADRAPIMGLAERFPPLPGGDRCAPVWLVVDFYRELPEAPRAELIDRIVGAPSSSLARGVEVTAAMGEPLAPLTRVIAQRACDVVAARTRSELDDIEAAIRDLEHAISLCVAAERMTALADLRGRVLGWLVDNGRAEDAWRLAEGLPPAEMGPADRAAIGGAVVLQRLGRGDLSGAIAMMETLSEGLGLEHEALRAARDELRDAIVAAVASTIESGDDEVARRLLDTAERLVGPADALRPHRIRVDLAEVLDVVEAGECLPGADRVARGERLRALRTEIARRFRSDSTVVDTFQRAERAWRQYQERCGR